MMGTYYYLAASLPMLHIHMAQPPLSGVSFLELCGRFVTPADLREISQASLISNEIHPESGVLRQWQEIDQELRNELVRIRAKRMNIDPGPYLRPGTPAHLWAERLRDIFEEFTPLRAEHHLMKLQWGILDDLESGHQFDRDFLVVYHIKLQILERKASFDAHRGMKRLESIIQGNGSNAE
jgi:hypothetical protein